MRKVRPGTRELRHRDWARRIRRSLRAPKVVAVFSPKGGVGKSTTALQVGEVLARLRGDLVAALDANPDSGNLVKRVREPYSVSTAGDLHADRAEIERYADLMPYLTQAGSGLCVVRSDPGAADRLGPEEYRETGRVPTARRGDRRRPAGLTVTRRSWPIPSRRDRPRSLASRSWTPGM